MTEARRAATSPSAAAPPRVASPRLVLATTILASSLAFIDGSVVNVGLPAIGASLAANGGGLSWVVNGYLLPLSALLLLGGAAGDVFGRRRMLVIGVAVFAVASGLCGLATDLPTLIAGRVLQGIGAAVLMPNSLAVMGANFAGEARGRAVGIWAAVGAAAGAAGPLLGGWMIDVIGWRPIFFINLPIAIGAIILAMLCLENEQEQHRRVLDLAGALLAAASLTAATWGLTAVSTSTGSGAPAAAALLAGTWLFVAFFWVERRRGEEAMMPLSLFRSTSFTGLTVFTLLLYGALGGLLVLVPFVLITDQGYSATMAGAALLPLPITIAIASAWMGKSSARIGPRLPLTVGSLVVAGGCVLATRIGSGGYWVTTFPAMFVISIGMAGAVAPLTTAVLVAVSRRHTGVASGLNNAVARTGGLVATALASVVLGASGPSVKTLFTRAAILAAAAAAAAAISALLWIKSPADERM
ncbi:MAG: MFS transporter [Pseudomonadota bacterium]|nr:MFS transporter [Pseudomonadota bacterium]